MEKIDGSAICLMCRSVITQCYREQTDRLKIHLESEHSIFFQIDLILKLHFLDKSFLEAIIDFPASKPKTVTESVEKFKQLFSANKFVTEDDSFVSLDSKNIESLSVNDNINDDIEGSKYFFKEKNQFAEYETLENSYNKGIDDFIKSLPKDICYDSEFDKSGIDSMDDSNYIMERINQMDQTLEDANLCYDNEDEGSKKKFKTQRIKCELCQKSLSKGSIKNHMRLVHFECDICSEKFESKQEVNSHKVETHPKEKRIKLENIKSSNSNHDENSQDSEFNLNLLLDDSTTDSLEKSVNLTLALDNTIEEIVDKFHE